MTNNMQTKNRKQHVIAGALLALLLAFSLSNALAFTLPKESAVPGGVVIIELAADSAGETPSAYYNDKPLLVIKKENRWLAIVGIPLTAKIGAHKIDQQTASGKTINHDFTINDKTYKTQRLTVTNKRKVNPYAEDMPRITAEKKRTQKTLAHWADIIDIASQVPSGREIAGYLNQVGGPTDVATLGLTGEEQKRAEQNGHYLRQRFTVRKLTRLLGLA